MVSFVEQLKHDDQMDSDQSILSGGYLGKAVQGRQHPNCDMNYKKDPAM